jgi:hypothetical protein
MRYVYILSCDLLYDLIYNYEKINRNYLNEKFFYNDIMENYLKFNNKYIFVHDKNNNLTIHNINKLPIFHPNFNYDKNYCLWKNKIYNNILDYCKIIENSYEIHVTFSSFFNLCMFLDLSKVTNKYIYTNIINIKDFHKNMKDWNIIMY